MKFKGKWEKMNLLGVVSSNFPRAETAKGGGGYKSPGAAATCQRLNHVGDFPVGLRAQRRYNSHCQRHSKWREREEYSGFFPPAC